jgi:hypothetical protein
MALVSKHFRLYILFQSKAHLIENVPLVSDVATAESTLGIITKDREVLMWDFD